MRKRMKSVIACILAATLCMGTILPVAADDGSDVEFIDGLYVDEQIPSADNDYSAGQELVFHEEEYTDEMEDESFADADFSAEEIYEGTQEDGFEDSEIVEEFTEPEDAVYEDASNTDLLDLVSNDEPIVESEEVFNEQVSEDMANDGVIISGQCGDNATYKLVGDTLTISGSGSMWDYQVSGEIIKATPWFDYRKGIQTVIIEDGITRIGGACFRELFYTENVVIPQSVTIIGEYAFFKTPLKEVSLPNNLKVIETGAFGYNDFLTINIPSSVEEIGDSAFLFCDLMEKIVIPKTVKKISRRTFYGCKNLQDVTLPIGIEIIEEEAFYYCSSLISLVIPNSVIAINDNAFGLCYDLEKLFIPESVEFIGTNALYTTCGDSIFDPILSDIFVVYGINGSYAEIYAKEHNIPFVIDESREKREEFVFLTDDEIRRFGFDNYGQFVKGGKAILYVRYFNSMSGISKRLSVSAKDTSKVSVDSVEEMDYGIFTYGTEKYWKIVISGIELGETVISAKLDSGEVITKNVKVELKSNKPVMIPAESYVTEKTIQEIVDTTNETMIIGKYQEIVREIDDYFKVLRNKANNEVNGLSCVGEIKKYEESIKNKTLSYTCTDEGIIEAAYYGLSLFYNDVVLKKPTIKSINLSKSLAEINNNIVNDVISQYWSYKTSVVYNKQYRVIVDIQGYADSLFGSITVNNDIFVVANPKQAWNTMADYLTALNNTLEEVLINGLKGYLKEVDSVTGISSYIKEKGKEKYEETVGKIYDYLKERGLGNLPKYSMYIYDICQSVSGLTNSLGNMKDIKKVFSNVENTYKTVCEYDFSDNTIKDKLVEVSLNKIKEKTKELEQMLYNYIYHPDESLSIERDFFDNMKTFFGGKKIKAECPVDLYVYDKSGNQLGYATDGNCNYIDPILIYVNNDVKTILVPNNVEVEIKAVSTGTGNMKYTVEEYDDKGKASIIKYNDIPLSIGTDYIQNLGEGRIDQNAIPAVVNERNNSYISAKEYIELIRKTKYTVNCSVDGKGRVIGSGEYGDENAALLAIADDGYYFDGWYENDTCLGNDYSLIIRDRKNHNITARFIEYENQSQGDPTPTPPVIVGDFTPVSTEDEFIEAYKTDTKEVRIRLMNNLVMKQGVHFSWDEVTNLNRDIYIDTNGFDFQYENDVHYLIEIPIGDTLYINKYYLTPELTFEVYDPSVPLRIKTTIPKNGNVWYQYKPVTCPIMVTNYYESYNGEIDESIHGALSLAEAIAFEPSAKDYIIITLLEDIDKLEYVAADYNGNDTKIGIGFTDPYWTGGDYNIYFNFGNHNIDPKVCVGIALNSYMTVIADKPCDLFENSEYQKIPGKQENGKWVYSGKYKKAQSDEKKIINISSAKVSSLKDQKYSGKSIKPNPIVTLNGKTLICNTDYSLSYKNNINAGKATVTITGKGQYTGTITKTFVIKKASQSMSVSVKTAKVKYSKLKNAKQSVKASSVFTIKKAKGKITYTKTNGSGKLSISKSGVITIKKGTKKGTYSMKVKVKAGGDGNYNAASKTVTVKVTVA